MPELDHAPARAEPNRPESRAKDDLPVPLNPAQRAARRRAQEELFKAHPNRYVAYLDVWTGDDLDRRVLAAADTLAECHRLMDPLPADVLDRAVVTHTPDPDTFVPAPASG
jgi:hypothetical protein